MAADIAKAYVQIIPTAEGIKGSLNKMFSNEATSAGESAGSKFSDGMKKTLGGAAKVAAGSLAAATTAVGALAKSSVDAYADFEQLEGGVQTLFGSASTIVMRNASKAFKTAGKSANEYMETSIQSAAALINSLEGDTVKAAELMDMSIVDMADNVNKMGTTMEGVENAYRGFSRGNFTMLDNLALGYAGTKEGMQQLLDKAKELSGVEYNIDSYSDIVQAIHVVQENMGIAGTTMKEGTETISGSIATLKSAWQNLITGFGRSDANLNVLINDVVEGAKTVLNNLQPIIINALKGISQFISEAAPIISKELPEIINGALPSLLNAAVDVVNALLLALPDVVQSLADVLPGVIERLMTVLTENSEAFVDGAVKIIDTLANALMDNADTLIPAAIDLVLALSTALLDHLDELMITATKIVVALADGVVASREELASRAPELMAALVEGITGSFFQLDELGFQTVNKFIDAIQTYLPNLIPPGMDFIINIIQGIIDNFDELFKVGGDAVMKFGEGIENMVTSNAEGWGGHLMDAFIRGIEMKHPILTKVINKVASAISGPLHHTHPDYGVLADDYKWMPDMVDSFAKGINDNSWKLTEAVDNMAGDVYQSMPMAAKEMKSSAPMASLAPAGYGDITIPVQIGNTKFGQATIKADQINRYRSGGR